MAITAAVEITDTQDFQELLEEHAEDRTPDRLPIVFRDIPEGTYQVVLHRGDPFIAYSILHSSDNEELAEAIAKKGYMVLEGKVRAVTL